HKATLRFQVRGSFCGLADPVNRGSFTHGPGSREILTGRVMMPAMAKRETAEPASESKETIPRISVPIREGRIDLDRMRGETQATLRQLVKNTPGLGETGAGAGSAVASSTIDTATMGQIAG